MRVCGIEISGKRANLALADEYGLFLSINPKYVELAQPYSSNSVRRLYTLINTIFRDHEVTHAAVKKRNERGDFAGGAMTFKIEGLVQLNDVARVEFVTIQQVSKIRKETDMPAPLNKYQHDAFAAALALTQKLGQP